VIGLVWETQSMSGAGGVGWIAPRFFFDPFLVVCCWAAASFACTLESTQIKMEEGTESGSAST
jgi:hypothetical protein